MPAVVVITFVLLLVIGRLTQLISGIRLEKLLWAMPILVMSLPVVASVAYSPLYGLASVALILGAWARDDRPWSGILLGLAICLRLWPGLIAVGFWASGKRRVVYESAATFVLLNLVGLALPGVTLNGSIASIVQGGSQWIDNRMNMSLVAALALIGVPIAISSILIAATGALLAFRNRGLAVPITVFVGLLASPLSWPTYALVVLPMAALYARLRSNIPVMALAVASASWSFAPHDLIGRIHLLIVVASLFLMASIRNVYPLYPAKVPSLTAQGR